MPLSSSTRLPAACRLTTACAEGLQGAGDVAVRPGRQPEEAGRPAPGEVVPGPGEVEGGAGVPGGAGDVAPGLRQ